MATQKSKGFLAEAEKRIGEIFKGVEISKETVEMVKRVTVQIARTSFLNGVEAGKRAARRSYKGPSNR